MPAIDPRPLPGRLLQRGSSRNVLHPRRGVNPLPISPGPFSGSVPSVSGPMLVGSGPKDMMGGVQTPVTPEMLSNPAPVTVGMAKGGKVKGYASGGKVRGGGCEQRGKTKGRFV